MPIECIVIGLITSFICGFLDPLMVNLKLFKEGPCFLTPGLPDWGQTFDKVVRCAHGQGSVCLLESDNLAQGCWHVAIVFLTASHGKEKGWCPRPTCFKMNAWCFKISFGAS